MRFSVSHPWRWLAAAVAAATLLAATPAGATMVVPLDLTALTDGAEQIALVRVEAQEARWTTDHGAIYTDVTLRIEKPIKGAGGEGETITVRREGGEVDGVGMRVFGAAGFSVGEEAVVFLERRGGATLWTVGMAQGKMRVAMVDGRKVAIRDHVGLSFVTPAIDEPRVQPLEDVIARIAARSQAVPLPPARDRINAPATGATPGVKQ